MSNEKFDDGFSIVELLVSLLLMAVLSVVLIPNLVKSMQSSSNLKTRTLAIAVNKESIAGAEAAASTSCAALNTYIGAAGNKSVKLATGQTMTVTFSPAAFACNATPPYSQTLAVTVTDNTSGQPVQYSSATTSVWITQ